MHLLTLLIAAVFSSQFTAPNALESVDSITPSEFKGLDFLFGLPLFNITVTGEADGDVDWSLVNQDTSESLNITEKVTVPNPMATTWKVEVEIDVTSLLGGEGAIPTTIDLIAKEGTETALSELTITVDPVPVFTVNAPGNLITFTDVTKMPQLTFATGDEYKWNDQMCARISVPGKEAIDIPIVQDDEDGTTYKTNPGKDISTLGLTPLSIRTVVMTIELVLQQGTESENPTPEIVHPTKVTPTLAGPEFLQFDAHPPTLTAEDKVEPKEITLAPIEGITWTKGTTVIKALVNKDDLSVPQSSAITLEVTEPATQGDRWTFTAPLPDLELTEADPYVYVWLKVDNVVLKIPFGIEYNEAEVPTGTFKVEPVTLTYAEYTTRTKDLNFTETSATPGTAWTSAVTAKLTNLENAEKTDEFTLSGLTTSGNSTAKLLSSVSLAFLEIPITGGTIKVELSPAGTTKFLAHTVNIQVDAKLPVFAIDIEKIEEASIDGVPFILTPTDDELTAWKTAGNAVSATFTATSTKPTIELPYTFPLKKPTAEGDKGFTGTAVLTGFDFDQLQDSKIYVWAKVKVGESDAEYRDVPDIVTYVPAAADPIFTVDIAGIKQEEMAAVTIEVFPNPTDAFDEKPIKIGFTTSDTIVTADPAVTLAVEQNEDEEWIATGNISALTVTTETTHIYLWIKIDTAWLKTHAQVTYTATPPAKFNITPAQVVQGKLSKADSPAFTIGIIKAAEKPPLATKSKVVFTAGSKTVPVEFEPTGNETDYTWVIKAGECDFATLNITTFPTVGKVDFYPSKDDAEPFGPAIPFTFAKAEEPKPVEAAMGVSPLLSLLGALVLLFVKLF